MTQPKCEEQKSPTGNRVTVLQVVEDLVQGLTKSRSRSG